jgi:hypothetical protein
MTFANWLKQSCTKLHSFISECVIPTTQMAANEWKNTIRECRNNIMNMKL